MKSPLVNSVLLLVLLLIGLALTHNLTGPGAYALAIAVAAVNYLIWGVAARRSRGQRASEDSSS